MSWTQTVLRLVELPSQTEPETPALARRKLRQLNEEMWKVLRLAKDEAATDGVSLSLVQLPDLYDYLTDEDPPLPGDYELRVAKGGVPNQLRFLDAEAARASAIGNPSEFESASILQLAGIDIKLDGGLGLQVIPWGCSIEITAHHVFGQPIRTVRDYGKSPTVPSNVVTWMVPDNGSIINLHPFFGPLATQRLALCLPNSVEGDPVHLVVRLEGKIKGKSAVEPVDDVVWQSPSLYRVLNDACRWVYSEPKETSNKHALLTGEIARAWSEGNWGEELSRFLEDALVSAQVAYRLHLQERGADAIKLMADLRKGVAEDVRGVSSQIGTLSAALWRDTTVALGTVALRNTGAVSDFVTVTVAIYLAIGGYLTLRWASQTVAAVGENEKVFRKSLYKPLLTDSTYKELALSRYDEVFGEFRAFSRIVAWVYCVAIFIVVSAVFIPWFVTDASGSVSYATRVLTWLIGLYQRAVTPFL